MKKRFGRKGLFGSSQDEQDVADPISKIQQQLSAIEQKLDTLISGSSQPSQRFNRPRRHDRGRRDNAFRERTFTKVICAECNKECEIPFKPSGDRPVYCKDCFSRRKQDNPFNTNRDNRPEERDFRRGRRSDRRQAEKREKPERMKKPFFARRKKRA